MLRLLVVMLLAFAASAFAGPGSASRPVDLDRPGAIEALKDRNPVHHDKIQRILQGAQRLPLPSIRGWIQAQFGATDVSPPLPIKTSFPPKARLSFTLDEVRYSATVTLVGTEGKVVPAE
ncbi:MAG: hypothetical protein H3C26_01755 [Rhodocyclaceae bacterium]|nr:hypothetical protein [Rhodocyclaceae bacterium]